jgi:hypothetical protein
MCRIVTFFLIPFVVGATKYAGEFQELGVGGRPCAMGGAGVAQFVEPSVVYFNPAGAYFVERAVLLMHAENFGGIVKNEFASLVMRRGTMALGFGVQYLSVGDIKFTTLSDTTGPPSSDNPPIPYDTVGTRDLVLYINGARGNDWLSYGATIKVFYRDLAVMTGYGGGADLGIAMRLDYLSIGLAVRDFVLSPIIWENGTRETIASKISLGVAPSLPLEKINSTITLACDCIKYLDYEGLQFNLGFEFGFREFAYGRAGIYDGNYTLGLGLRYKQFALDYSLVTHSELNNSNKISAGYAF